MIRVTGVEGTNEYAAGCLIRDALLSYWPKLEETPSDGECVLIACNAKIAGYRIQDYDVVLCAKLREGRRFVPTRPVRTHDGTVVTKQPIAVLNLAVAIEVKSHDASGVQFANGGVLVRYSRNGETKWEGATEKNHAQAHELKQYFLDQQIKLYVRRLLVMQGLPTIPAGIDGTVPSQFGAAQLLTEIASTAAIFAGREPILSSGDSDAIARGLQTSIFREVQASPLDRQRMDRIASKRGLSDEWFQTMGQKLLTLRGRGGTGKTVLLLQAAWRAYDEKGARTLILTYNRALVADMRRIMALMNIPGSAPESGITIDSIMSFIISWIRQLGIVPPHELSNLELYNENCQAAAEYLRSGAITREDIDRIKDAHPDQFSFDLVMADEGQDWPQDEAEIIKLVYGTERIVTADGIDQLLRGQRCDWQRGVPEEGRKLVRLRRCLRMKANLASFANSIARQARIDWSTEPNPEAAGGRIIILRGSYGSHPDIHQKLVTDAKAAGNEVIDFLVCVPFTDVVQHGSVRHSGLGRLLANSGSEIWDATDRDVRRDFARGVNTLRIVQYQSCRGLEGWTVIAEGLDRHWRTCFEHYLNDHDTSDDFFHTPEDAARSDAWHRTLIPLTRSIDTLVITLEYPESDAAKAILTVAQKHKDFAEIMG